MGIANLVKYDWGPSASLEDYFDPDYDNLFGVQAENKTFGGGTSQSTSINSAASSSKSFGYGYTMDISESLSLDFNDEITFLVGALGVGTIKKVSDHNIQIGQTYKYESTTSSNKDTARVNTVEIGYELTDDETGDQFSVSIIQGPTQNHTPYFYLFGGRSSCPPEEGTILRDDPQIALFDAATNTTTDKQSRYNVPANEAAEFLFRIENNTPFPIDPRSLFVFLNNSSNLNGARVRLNGTLLGDEVYCDIPANSPQTFSLTVERGAAGNYIFEDLEIVVSAWCSDPGSSCTGGAFAAGETQSVFISAYFQSPCSPVTLVKPDDNWVFNGNDEKLVIAMRDYQPDNAILEEIKLQHRRLGVGDAWKDIPPNQLDLSGPVTPAILTAFNDDLAEGIIPEYAFFWDVPDEAPLNLLDGNYEIRALADCGADQTVSNTVPGIIDRSGLLLKGDPEPADGIWTEGNEISFRFNKDLDCPVVQNADFIKNNIHIVNRSDNNDTLDFTMTCYNNELVFLTDEEMSNYDGDTLEVILEAVEGINGSGLLNPEYWPFRVVTQEMYFEKDTLHVFMYEGESQMFSVRLNNSNLPVNQVTLENVRILDKEAPQNGWLEWSPTGLFDVSPLDTDIGFTLSADDLGTSTETIVVVYPTITDTVTELSFKLTVLPKPPYWEVDHNLYPKDMTVVANWYFEGTTAPDDFSKDSMDQITVWIDGEIRGVANIIHEGNGFYAARPSVSGHTADEGKPMEFRIWDADTGTEYDGHPAATRTFEVDGQIGSAGQPERLVVNSDTDKARYIPLNGPELWTWFSINSEEEDDMSLARQLRSLSTEAEGDEIKTNNQIAVFENGEWMSAGDNALTELDVDKAYMIYLENGPDTLRLTGSNATVSDIPLVEKDESDPLVPGKNGWNWVGYPLQEEQPINPTLTITESAHGTRIKTTRQTGESESADYHLGTGDFLGTLMNLRPYDGYKVFNNRRLPATMTYDNNFAPGNTPQFAMLVTPADPADPTTWEVSDYGFEFAMRFIATVAVSNVLSDDPLDQLAVFNGDELRGTGKTVYVPSMDKYLLSLLVGDTALNEDLTLYFYDASTSTVYEIEDHFITFQESGYGSFTTPYPINIGSKIWHVELNGDDSNTGETWGEAFATVQRAVESAAPTDSIWVAAGTYLPTKDVTGNASPANNRDKTFYFNSNVHIYGSFTVDNASLLDRDLLNNLSILSGDFNGNDGANFANNGENAYSVVTTENLSDKFRMDGFQISGGNANANGGGNGANVSGGGWYNDGTGGPSNPTITNCVFSENTADLGGGMANLGLNGGESNPAFINCAFHHNEAEYDGGAIYNWGENGTSSPDLVNCTFAENIAGSRGGGLFNNGNNSGTSHSVITNTIFFGNHASSGKSLYNSNASALLNYSLLEETDCPSGASCNIAIKFNQNPLFADAANGDLHLMAGSEAIDAGLNAALPAYILYDQNGLLRVFNGGVDHGAYELHDCNIADVTPPNPACKTTTINMGTDTDYTLLENDVFDGGTDDCGAVTFVSMTPTSVGCSDIGTPVSVTVTAQDDSGNENTCDATITVEAASNSHFCKTTNVQLGLNSSYALSESEVFDAGAGGCNVVTFTSMAPNSLDCSDTGGPVSVIVTAHDGNGNQVNCVATINVGGTDYPCCPPTHVIYVNANTPDDNDGSSWDNAFASLQRALELADRCPIATEVWVAAGTYFPDDSPFHTAGDRNESFILQNGLAIYGGFAGGETNLTERDIEANPSILSGDIGTAGDGSDNSYHVVYNNGGGINATALLEGLTITAGNADGLGDDGKGAGMFNKSASPTIRHCKFDGNNADVGGGGMYVIFASPTLDTCAFVNNHAQVGGGVYNLSLTSTAMTGCLFDGNSATGNGGAVFNNNTLLPTVTGCVFDGNTAGQNGGGIHNISGLPGHHQLRFPQQHGR